jgi:hypothetical protein
MYLCQPRIVFAGGLLLLGCSRDVDFAGEGAGGSGGGPSSGGETSGAGAGPGRSGGAGGREPVADGGNGGVDPGTSGGSGGQAAGGSTSSGSSTSDGGSTFVGGAPSTGGQGTGGSVQNECWDLDGFYDDFQSEDYTERCWLTHKSEALAFGTSPGGYSFEPEGLLMRPEAGTSWSGDTSAFLLYQELSGDFRLEAQVWVLGEPPGEGAPESHDTFAGLVFYPGSLSSVTGHADEYYSIKVGRFTNTAGIIAQVKEADLAPRSVQVEDNEAWDNTYVRICRVGDSVWSAYLPSGQATWIPLHENGASLGYDTRDEGFPRLSEIVSVGVSAEMGDTEAEDGSARIVVNAVTIVPTDSIDSCARQF